MHGLIMPTPTFHESAPCWSNHPDPVCQPDQWLDRSGLIGVATPQPYTSATENVCQCRQLAPGCPENSYWDVVTGLCVCLQQCPCAVNEYYNQNTCRCECVDYAVCANEGGHDMYWSSADCACKCVPHPELCTSTAQSNSVWNNSTC